MSLVCYHIFSFSLKYPQSIVFRSQGCGPSFFVAQLLQIGMLCPLGVEHRGCQGDIGGQRIQIHQQWYLCKGTRAAVSAPRTTRVVSWTFSASSFIQIWKPITDWLPKVVAQQTSYRIHVSALKEGEATVRTYPMSLLSSSIQTLDNLNHMWTGTIQHYQYGPTRSYSNAEMSQRCVGLLVMRSIQSQARRGYIAGCSSHSAHDRDYGWLTLALLYFIFDSAMDIILRQKKTSLTATDQRVLPHLVDPEIRNDLAWIDWGSISVMSHKILRRSDLSCNHTNTFFGSWTSALLRCKQSGYSRTPHTKFWHSQLTFLTDTSWKTWYLKEMWQCQVLVDTCKMLWSDLDLAMQTSTCSLQHNVELQVFDNGDTTI